MRRYSIYIPESQLVEQVTKRIAEEFGGVTAMPITGSWIMKDGSLVQEPITLIYTLVDTELSYKAVLLFDQLAELVRTELNQETVLVTVDEVMSVKFVS